MRSAGILLLGALAACGLTSEGQRREMKARAERQQQNALRILADKVPVREMACLDMNDRPRGPMVIGGTQTLVLEGMATDTAFRNTLPESCDALSQPNARVYPRRTVQRCDGEVFDVFLASAIDGAPPVGRCRFGPWTEYRRAF